MFIEQFKRRSWTHTNWLINLRENLIIWEIIYDVTMHKSPKMNADFLRFLWWIVLKVYTIQDKTYIFLDLFFKKHSIGQSLFNVKKH